jgi:hypothetical protein
MRASHTITPLFDDPNLVGSAGLVPALRLAESAGLYDLLAQHLSVESPNGSVALFDRRPCRGRTWGSCRSYGGSEFVERAGQPDRLRGVDTQLVVAAA